MAALETDDAIAFGHTHQFWYRTYGHVLFVNVGTVGRPKDGDPRAAYVVLTAPDELPIKVDITRVPYDVEAAARAVLAVGLPPELADGLKGC